MKNDIFFKEVKASLFGGKLSQDQVDGMNSILVAMDEVGDGDPDTLAYALATAYHETGARMVPVREGFAKTNNGAISAVARLAAKRGPNSAPAKYGKPAGKYGHVYYGRGYVQLTWHSNYVNCSEDAGVDLEKYPDAMLDPVISARVLIKGLMDGRWNGQGKGLDFYEGEDDVMTDAEAEEARRTVNVKDKAKLVASYYRKFYNALIKAGWGKRVATPKKVSPAEAVGGSVVAVGTAAGAALASDYQDLVWPVVGAVAVFLVIVVLARLYKNRKGS